MFHRASVDFVSTACGDTARPVQSINQAFDLRPGSFCIKRRAPVFFLSDKYVLYSSSLVAPEKELGALTTSVNFIEYNRDISITADCQLNISLIKQIGADVKETFRGKVVAHLGPVIRSQLDISATNSYVNQSGKVPESLMRTLKKKSRTVLCVVTEVFSIEKPVELVLDRDFSIENSVDAVNLPKADAKSDFSRDRSVSVKLSAGQPIAYSVRECHVSQHGAYAILSSAADRGSFSDKPFPEVVDESDGPPATLVNALLDKASRLPQSDLGQFKRGLRFFLIDAPEETIREVCEMQISSAYGLKGCSSSSVLLKEVEAIATKNEEDFELYEEVADMMCELVQEIPLHVVKALCALQIGALEWAHLSDVCEKASKNEFPIAILSNDDHLVNLLSDLFFMDEAKSQLVADRTDDRVDRNSLLAIHSLLKLLLA